MPIYLDPNPLNTCCSSAGPPLSLQIRLNSAAVFQFGQKLHPNLCMEGECTIRSLSGPYIFLHLVALCSFLWHPWVSPQLFWVWFFHTSGRECSTEPVLPSQCDSYPEKGRNCSSFQRKFFRVWFCLLCIFFSIQQIADIREGIQIRNCTFPSYIFLLHTFRLLLTEIFLGTKHKFFLLQVLEYNH